MMTRQGKR